MPTKRAGIRLMMMTNTQSNHFVQSNNWPCIRTHLTISLVQGQGHT